MTLSCTDATVALGSYVLGALDHDERREVEGHLSTCPACRDELAALAPLPGLLSRLSVDEALAGPPPADASLLDRVLAAAAAERRQARQRRILAAAAAAVLVAGAVAGGGAAWHLTHEGSWQHVSASRGPVHIDVALEPVATGTELRLSLTGVRAETRCRLIAVSAAGQREVAGWWEASYRGAATVDGTTSIPRSRLRELVVQADDGTVLVTAAVPPAT